MGKGGHNMSTEDLEKLGLVEDKDGNWSRPKRVRKPEPAPVKRGTNKEEEYLICKRISEYLRDNYPSVVFHWDLAGLKLSKAQAGKLKVIQGDRGWPDLFIARAYDRWHGMYMEIKYVTPYLADGRTLKSDKHLEEQQANHEKLRAEGYWADFVTGFDEAKEIIDNYLNP